MRYLLLALALVASPAFAKAPTDRAEGTIQASATEAGGLIASGCLDKGWTVAERTEFQVVCEGEEILMPLYGNMRIREVYTFNLIGADGATRVRATSISHRRRPIGNAIELEGTGGKDMAALLSEVSGAQ